MCVQLIIEETCPPCQVSLPLSLRHEEEEGFRSPAVSLSGGREFKKNEGKVVHLFCSMSMSALCLWLQLWLSCHFQTWETRWLL